MTQLPVAFTEQMSRILPGEINAFTAAIDGPVATSIRVNPFKPNTHFIHETNVPWCSWGYYLNSRPSFIADPLFHAGTYYVQESSSMFLQQVWNAIQTQLPEQPIVLDLCAAPGGKSTLLASLLNNKGLLVSNEVIQSRVKILTENMEKWGSANNLITHNDPQDFSGCKNIFDVMVVDAPCSGEGLFRKDKKAIDEWSEENVNHCSLRQQRILSQSLSALKPGGFLIYATCTFNTLENETNIIWLQEEFGFESKRIPIETNWGIQEVTDFEGQSMYAYRFFPQHVKGEGLFMCCLQKPMGTTAPPFHTISVKPIAKADLEVLRSWIKNPEEIFFLKTGNAFSAIPKLHEQTVLFLDKKLKVVRHGITMGEIMQGKLIPDHHLALSGILNDAVERTDLTLSEAQRVLKKDTLSIANFPNTGWQLVTYMQHPFAWVKVLPNRINNYFPTHLRVLKDIYHESA